MTVTLWVPPGFTLAEAYAAAVVDGQIAGVIPDDSGAYVRSITYLPGGVDKAKPPTLYVVVTAVAAVRGVDQ